MPKSNKQMIVEALAVGATHRLTLKPNPDRGDHEAGEHTNYRTGEVRAVAGRRRLGSDGRRTRRTITGGELEVMLKRLVMRMHRRLLGRDARSARFAGQRVTGYAIVEDLLPDNGHLHLILRVPERLTARFEAIFTQKAGQREETLWTKVCPGGSSHVSPIDDAERWAEYCLKRLGNFKSDGDFDLIIPIT